MNHDDGKRLQVPWGEPSFCLPCLKERSGSTSPGAPEEEAPTWEQLQDY